MNEAERNSTEWTHVRQSKRIKEQENDLSTEEKLKMKNNNYNNEGKVQPNQNSFVVLTNNKLVNFASKMGVNTADLALKNSP